MKQRRDADFDNLFDREAAEQLRAERAERVRLGEEAARLEDERRARDKAAGDELRARANEEARLAQFRAAGVEPPKATTSLSLLLRLGWTLVDSGEGKRALVAPPAPEPWTGHRDADSLPEEAKR